MSMKNTLQKVSSQTTAKSVLPCLSYLLTIVLDSLPNSLGNQPAKVQELFYHYCHQGISTLYISDTTISSWKSGNRVFDHKIIDYYESNPREFIDHFQQNIFHLLEDPIEIAEEFYSVISRSYDSQHRSSLDRYKKVTLACKPESFTDQECASFLAESLYHFMNHLEYVVKFGVTAGAPDFILGCKTPAPCRHFCGRDNEKSLLHQMLLESRHTFVTGFSGMGKSELVWAYAQEYSQNYSSYYKYTFSVTFHDSLRETILRMPFSCDAEIRTRYNIRRDQMISSLGKNPDAFKQLQEELRKLEQQLSDELFSTHDRLLFSLHPNTLMVIDNMNIRPDEDPLLSHILDYPFHILITTQYDYADYPHLKLTEIQNDCILTQLVASYFKNADNYSAEIAEMISLLHRHTLFIELCSKLLGMGAVRMQELLEKLRVQKVKLDAEDLIRIRKDSMDLSDTFRGYLRMLFPFFHLDPEEQYILTNLALFPTEGIPLTDFKEWMNLNPDARTSDNERSVKRRYISAVYILIEKGLIQNRDGVLSMHSLIQDVVIAEDEVAPSIRRCHSLLSSLQNICRGYCKNISCPETVFLVLMNTSAFAEKDEDTFYLSLLKDAYFAAIFQSYQPGIQILSADLEKYLGPSGSPMDALHESMLHYIKACNAETPEKARAEYQAIVDGLQSQPIENILNPEIEPELSPFFKNMAMAAVKQAGHEIGPEGMEDIKGKLTEEANYLFCSPEGTKELTGIMSGIFGAISQAAAASMCGKSAKLIGSDILNLVSPEKPDKK